MDALFNQKSISAFEKVIESGFQEQDNMPNLDEDKQTFIKEYDKFVVENDIQVDVDRAYLERYVACPISSTMKSLNHEKLANISK